MNFRKNPMGTDGFEFIEFSAPDPNILANTFIRLGFTPTAQHKTKAVTLYQQGNINFILNAQASAQASEHSMQHGPGACAMAFRVNDAKRSHERALSLGAENYDSPLMGKSELYVPAIKAIGGSVIYFVDQYQDNTIYDVDFIPLAKTNLATSAGLKHIDHLTHNVFRGNMERWADFYIKLFNFHEIRFFDIKGQETGLISRALASPCGKIKIPLNESVGEKSQIEEFLHDYNGEGIQHIALSTDNIYETVETLQENGVQFLDTPDSYYDMIHQRIPWHQEDLSRLQKNKILIDGGNKPEGGLLLQIFTHNIFGPEFFEIIERKGHEGFGEGNFQALFEAIERDQIKRGYLKS